MRQETRHPRIISRQQLLVAAVAACFTAGAHALPIAPTVVNGTAGFAQSGNALTVTNSAGAIINWQKFGIAVGETTRFIQPSASSAVLNQVVGVNGIREMSQIHGTLSSNGKVWLINPAGILVGASGVIDTAGFIASTLNVRAEDFLAGRLNFQATPGAGDVVNRGTITTPTGGSVYLVGSNVSNEAGGVITTPGGETVLAAGATVDLLDTSTPGVKVAITGAANNATNLGSIVAEAGRIGIAGTIVRNSGTLDASSVVNEGGRIFLKASQDTYVDGAGRIVSTGTKGGQVEVLGNRVAVMDQASIDVSGTNGGGTIKVGGDYQGKNPAIQNAQITFFGPEATLKANAIEVGAGGTVIVWADDTTRAYGSIEARGGANGGNGGFVETSGHRYLDYQGLTDTRAPHGEAGMLLLDPTDITIQAGGGVTGGVLSGTFTPGAATATIGWNDIITQLGTTPITISTSSAYGGSGNISFSAGASYSSGLALTFNAQNYINGNGVTIQNTGTGAISFIGANGITGSGINVSSGGQITFNSANGNVNLGNGTISSSFGGTAISVIATNGSASIGHLNTTNATGNVSVVASGQILDANSSNAGENNISTNGGSISLTSSYGGTASGVAISVDTAGANNISASVGASATFGGIAIRHTGNAPNNLILSDNSATVANNYVDFFASGNITLNSPANYSFTGRDISIEAGGNLTYSDASFSGTNPEIALLAGNTLTINNSLSVSGGLALVAGSTVNVNGDVTSAGDMIIAAGISKAVTDSIDAAPDPDQLGNYTAAAGSTINISKKVASTGEHVGLLGGNINVIGAGATPGGAVVSAYDIYAFSEGNITLSNGAYMDAGTDVNLTLRGSSSVLSLNPTAGLANSYILARAPSTINLTFTNLASGGIVINGIQTILTSALFGYGSGLYYGYPNPLAASPGFGLNLIYGASNSTLINTITNTIIESTNEDPTIYDELPTVENIANADFLVTDETIGGGDEEFGEGQTEDDPLDLRKKKYAQCKG